MEKAAATAQHEPKIKIRKEIFLGKIKLEDFLLKEASLILEKYK
jgi:hypothetical protein